MSKDEEKDVADEKPKKGKFFGDPMYDIDWE